MVKAYLQLLGRTFVERNVSSDPQGRAELLAMADERLYQAKKSGRNRVVSAA